jgi:hypothetical protein
LNATIELQEESEILVEEFNTKDKQCEQNEDEIKELNQELKKETALRERADEQTEEHSNRVKSMQITIGSLQERHEAREREF